MATNSSKAKSTPKTMDVSHPGRAMPNPTSRPTIVGHHAILQDPMVTSASGKVDDKPAISMTGRKLTPLSEAAKPANKAPAGDVTEAEAPATDTATEEAVATVPDAKSEKTEAAEPSEASEPEAADSDKPSEVEAEEKPAAADDAKPAADNDKELADAPGNKAEEQKAAEKKLQEDTAKQEAIDKLVTEKTYFVPIGQQTRKRSKRHAFVWVIFGLVLLALLADLLVDSGMVKTSIKPPISIFKTTSP